MNQNIYKIFSAVGGVILLGAILIGVFYYRNLIIKPEADSVDISAVGEDQSSIKKFANYEELKDFLAKAPERGIFGFGGDARIGATSMDSQMIGAAPAAEFAPKAMQAGADYSTTNIQVAGVDEADIIKTDGNYIYVVSGKNIFIVEAYPADSAKIISKIELKSTPQNLYINGDSLVILGQDDTIYEKMQNKMIAPHRYSQYSFVKVFDISDKKNPKQLRDLDFEGNMNNSRMIGDYVYAITTSYSYGDDAPLPIILENGELLPSDTIAPRCNCPDVYYFNIPYQSYNLTSVSSINIKDNSQPIKNEVYLLDGNQNIYVSQNNIYIVYTKYLNEYQLALEVMKEIIMPRLSVKDQDRVKKIENTDSDILSKQEKLAKIDQIIQRYRATLPKEEQDALEKELEEKMKQKYADISKELEKTVIHKIAIDKENLKYQAVSEVVGAILNQFSMDENGEYFRIATTKNRSWSQFTDKNELESYSNIYVLDKDLNLVGRVENLAPGERIYSVRFMQDRAYMVTFKQVDPLFVIDLKDPRDPKELGKLKIPGFSNYLHPYDDTTLIGIGKDTEEASVSPLSIDQGENMINDMMFAPTPRVVSKGIKISLFDVSDVANPKEAAKYVLGDSGSDSIALYDHKAFLFNRDKNLLVIPAQIYENSNQTDVGCGTDGRLCPEIQKTANFNGAAVFHIEKDKLELRGKISHMDGDLENPDYYYESGVLRSLYIQEMLYTMSNKFIKANKLDDLSDIKKLELKKESSQDYTIINE